MTPNAIQPPKKVGDHTEYDIVTSGCLFDLDGTLMLSSDSVECFWKDFCNKNGIDSNELLSMSHGVRTIDVFRHFKPEYANFEKCSELEATIPGNWKHLAKPIPGVKEFLLSLPESQWGIVTSGTYRMASTWLSDFLLVTPPEVFITAEKIEKGKPHPMGYLTGKELLSLTDNFLVFEDAPAGIKAGKDAGATVIGMATTYDAKKVKESGADIVIPDLTHIKVKSWDASSKKLVLTITDPIIV